VIQEGDSPREEFRIEGAQEEEIQILERIGDIRNIKWEKRIMRMRLNYLIFALDEL
jgi:hypothetical protein